MGWTCSSYFSQRCFHMKIKMILDVTLSHSKRRCITSSTARMSHIEVPLWPSSSTNISGWKSPHLIRWNFFTYHPRQLEEPWWRRRCLQKIGGPLDAPHLRALAWNWCIVRASWSWPKSMTNMRQQPSLLISLIPNDIVMRTMIFDGLNNSSWRWTKKLDRWMFPMRFSTPMSASSPKRCTVLKFNFYDFLRERKLCPIESRSKKLTAFWRTKLRGHVLMMIMDLGCG